MKALSIKPNLVVVTVITFAFCLNICLAEEKIQKKDIKKLVKTIATISQLCEQLSSENDLFARDSLYRNEAKVIKYSWERINTPIQSFLTEVKLSKQWKHFTVWQIDYLITDAPPKYIAVGYDGGIYYLSGFEREQFGNMARNQIKNVP